MAHKLDDSIRRARMNADITRQTEAIHAMEARNQRADRRARLAYENESARLVKAAKAGDVEAQRSCRARMLDY